VLDVWALATTFLAEAEHAPAAAIPRMATHGAYYAMFHAARAVLIRIDGTSAPAKHTAVVNRFGFQANQDEWVAAARAPNRMEARRIRSDYNAGTPPSPAEAAAAVIEARRFLQTCAGVHGFPPP
jgi:uncharacterized protein (UPF0332 family)